MRCGQWREIRTAFDGEGDVVALAAAHAHIAACSRCRRRARTIEAIDLALAAGLVERGMPAAALDAPLQERLLRLVQSPAAGREAPAAERASAVDVASRRLRTTARGDGARTAPSRTEASSAPPAALVGDADAPPQRRSDPGPCPRRDALELALDGAGDPAVRAHLEVCERCQRRAHQTALLDEALLAGFAPAAVAREEAADAAVAAAPALRPAFLDRLKALPARAAVGGAARAAPTPAAEAPVAESPATPAAPASAPRARSARVDAAPPVSPLAEASAARSVSARSSRRSPAAAPAGRSGRSGPVLAVRTSGRTRAVGGPRRGSFTGVAMAAALAVAGFAAFATLRVLDARRPQGGAGSEDATLARDGGAVRPGGPGGSLGGPSLDPLAERDVARWAAVNDAERPPPGDPLWARGPAVSRDEVERHAAAGEPTDATDGSGSLAGSPRPDAIAEPLLAEGDAGGRARGTPLEPARRPRAPGELTIPGIDEGAAEGETTGTGALAGSPAERAAPAGDPVVLASARGWLVRRHGAAAFAPLDGTYSEVAPGDELKAGRAGASLALGRGVEVAAQADARFALAHAGHGQGLRLSLAEGTLLCQTSADTAGGGLRVDLGLAEVEARGGRAVVARNGAQAQVDVLEGEVALSTGPITAGNRLSLAPDRAPEVVALAAAERRPNPALAALLPERRVVWRHDFEKGPGVFQRHAVVDAERDGVRTRALQARTLEGDQHWGVIASAKRQVPSGTGVVIRFRYYLDGPAPRGILVRGYSPKQQVTLHALEPILRQRQWSTVEIPLAVFRPLARPDVVASPEDGLSSIEILSGAPEEQTTLLIDDVEIVLVGPR